MSPAWLFLEDGYRAVWRPSDAQRIDEEIAERMRCPKCGGPCRYEGWENGKGSYIALAVCRRCGYEQEF